MTKKNPNKVVGAWLVIQVKAQRIVSEHLAIVSGLVLQSNFLDPDQQFEMPVLTAGLQGVDVDDKIKVVYFTTKGELDSFLSGDAGGFIDRGLRYFKDIDGSWDLVYEDFDSKP